MRLESIVEDHAALLVHHALMASRTALRQEWTVVDLAPLALFPPASMASEMAMKLE